MPIRASQRAILYSVLLLLCCVCINVAQAQVTIHVPADQSTIQAAIVAAHSGDTVLVSAGTYHEHLDFLGKAITVTSADGPAVTIIDGDLTGTVVIFHNSETNAAVLHGFTITRGKNSTSSPQEAGGIEIDGASPTIDGNIITNNQGCAGVGIYSSGGSPIIQNNTISNNRQTTCSGGTGGGGIALFSSANGQVIGNTITGNYMGAWGGGLVVAYGGTPTIKNNVISKNSASDGGGIDIFNSAVPRMIQNVITDNAGGGVSWLAPSGTNPIVLLNNTIANNDGANGSALRASGWDSAATVANNLLIAKDGQTAVYCDTSYDPGPPVMSYNIVFSNGGSTYAGSCGDLTGTSHNISVDPLFANLPAGDYHLSTASPAIDAADPTTNPVFTTDAGGEPRLVGAGLDMGAYEYQGETTFSVTPSGLTFITQKTHTQSAAQSVTVTNTGSKALHLKPVQIGSDFVETDNCAGAAGLGSGVSCTIAVSFLPLTAGAKLEALVLAGANSASSGSVDLSGTGSASIASLSPTALDFGDQMLSTTSAVKMVALTNSGDADLAVSSVSVSGDFAINHNCGTVAPGASCAIGVTFTPTLTRSRTGAITIADDAPGAPHSVTLVGNGTGPEIAFNPTTLTFPGQQVGTIGSPLKVTVRNTGTSDLNISAIQIVGDYSQSNTCTSVLSAGASCDVSVTFLPTLYGSRPGTLSFSDNAALSPQTVTLLGAGIAPIASLTPTSITFAEPVVVGYSSSQSLITYRNLGNDVLLLSGISATGDFKQTNACPSVLAPYGICQIAVTFTPTQTGARTGSVVITDNAYGSPRTVSLTAQGIATFPTPSVTSVSPESAKVSNANVVLTINGSGFTASSIAYLDGQALTTTYVNSGQLSAPLGSPISIGEHAVTVSNPTPGGGSSNTAKVTGYLSIPLSARDLVYDPYRRVFYASIAAAASTSPNTIVPIDPSSGQTGTPIPIGSDPSALAISDDGQFLWVGVNGEYKLKRLNLYTKQVDLTINMSGTGYFTSLAAVPGAPHSVAVIWNGSSPYLTIYDDDVPRPKAGNIFYGAWLAFCADASTLYATDGGISPSTLYSMTVDATGITSTSSRWNAGGAELHYLGGRLYANSRIYDAATLTDAGYFGFITSWATAVLPEAGTGLTYLLEAVSDGTGNAIKIWSANGTTLAATGHLQVSVPNSYDRPILRWGRDGLAFRYYGGSLNLGGATPQDQVILARSSITNPSTTDNPVPSITSLSPATIGAGAKNLVLTVNGSNFVPGAVVRWNGADRSTLFVNSTTVRASIPSEDLVTAGTASVTVENPTPAGGESAAGQFMIGSLLSISAQQLDFGNQAKGTVSTARTITVTNGSGSSVAISQISISGDFLQTNNCGASLASGAACTISVTFHPSAEGSRTGALTINADSVVAVPLLGTGLGSAVSISPTTLDFGQVIVGGSSTLNATLTNPGPADLKIISITASGPFTETDTCGTSLAAGANCTIAVKFTPNSTGQASGVLTIQHDSSSGSTTLQLQSVGTDFVIAAQGGATSSSITAGQSATYALTVNGSDQFSGAVSFSCLGAPSLATCNVNPASVTLQKGAQANVTVTVATTAAGVAGLRALPPAAGPFSSGPAVAVSGALACLFLSLRRAWKRALLLPSCLALVLAMASCGGGGSKSTPTPTPGTPSGSYVVKVTATASGVSKTLDLNLIVK